MSAEYAPSLPDVRDSSGLDAGRTEAVATNAGSAMTTATTEVAPIQRKIIYTAEVNLVVEDFGPLPERIAGLVKQCDAYIARSNISGMPGQPRRGVWTVRVPVARYEEFLTAVRGLGEVKSVLSDSKDVTAEFYDIEARIRNKQREEGRLLQLLDDVTGKLQDILEVEREVSRVRGEIEQLQGRLRVLRDLTAMTTVEVRVDELRDYVPEAPQAPTYATRVQRAFAGSVARLVAVGQECSIALVALAPWLAVLAILALLVFAVARLLWLGRAER
jgi:hypothetical protein